MDVTFLNVKSQRDFTIEIGYFDTVKEIKEKIQKYHGIPIDRQTLFFNDRILMDQRNTTFYEILHHSIIYLLVDPEPPNFIAKLYGVSPPSLPLLQLNVRIPLLLGKQFSVDMEASDSIKKLKIKIHHIQWLPVNQLSVVFNGKELNDNQSLEDCAIPNHAEITVFLRPMSSYGPPSVYGASLRSKRLKLMVLPKEEAEKIVVEVNRSDRVRELKKELQALQQKMKISLPSEGYYFIYKQSTMDENHSFRWHGVEQGDTIEIFTWSVPNGSWII